MRGGIVIKTRFSLFNYIHCYKCNKSSLVKLRMSSIHFPAEDVLYIRLSSLRARNFIKGTLKDGQELVLNIHDNKQV